MKEGHLLFLPPEMRRQAKAFWDAWDKMCAVYPEFTPLLPHPDRDPEGFAKLDPDYAASVVQKALKKIEAESNPKKKKRRKNRPDS